MKYLKYSIYGLIIVLVLILIIFFINREDVNIILDPAPEIKKSIIDSDKNSDIVLSNENIVITHIGGSYARANLVDTDTNFYLVKVNDSWSNVITSKEPIYCERAERLGFPINFVDDCILQFPDSITLQEHVENPDSIEATIVVTVSNNQDPFCDCLTVEDDDKEFTFAYSGNTDNFTPGEVVVIDVIQNEIIEIIDDDINIDNENGGSNEEEPNSGSGIYINPNPETTRRENLELNFIDIDHSQRAIQLRND